MKQSQNGCRQNSLLIAFLIHKHGIRSFLPFDFSEMQCFTCDFLDLVSYERFGERWQLLPFWISEATFVQQAEDAGLSQPWIEALRNNYLATFAKLSFAVTSPGVVAPG